jgi:hypothetical protein
MITDTLQTHTNTHQTLFNERADELIEMVRTRHPEARFYPPAYWAGEQLWLINAFFDNGEDFELEDKLSERETDILLEDNIWLGVLLMPLSAYEPSGAGNASLKP